MYIQCLIVVNNILNAILEDILKSDLFSNRLSFVVGNGIVG